MWRNLQRHKVIVSGGKVNWLIDGRCGERLPAIGIAAIDGRTRPPRRQVLPRNRPPGLPEAPPALGDEATSRRVAPARMNHTSDDNPPY